MTQEERENLISGFLSANAGNTDVNTTRMLNMLVESLAYSKLQELLPDVQKQSAPSQIQKDKQKKTYLKFTKKELEQMTAKYKHIFAHGDKIVTYRQKKNGVFEARFHRQGIKRLFPNHHTHDLRYTFITRCNVRVQKGNYEKIIASKQLFSMR